MTVDLLKFTIDGEAEAIIDDGGNVRLVSGPQWVASALRALVTYAGLGTSRPWCNYAENIMAAHAENDTFPRGEWRQLQKSKTYDEDSPRIH